MQFITGTKTMFGMSQCTPSRSSLHICLRPSEKLEISEVKNKRSVFDQTSRLVGYSRIFSKDTMEEASPFLAQ